MNKEVYEAIKNEIDEMIYEANNTPRTNKERKQFLLYRKSNKYKNYISYIIIGNTIIKRIKGHPNNTAIAKRYIDKNKLTNCVIVSVNSNINTMSIEEYPHNYSHTKSSNTALVHIGSIYNYVINDASNSKYICTVHYNKISDARKQISEIRKYWAKKNARINISKKESTEYSILQAAMK